MRLRLAAALAAAATIAAGVLAAPTAPALGATGNTSTTITPSALPRGKAAHDYLVGRTIHPATGSVVRLPRSWKPAQLTLVGHSTKGWIIDRYDGVTGAAPDRLYRVTRGSVRLIRSVDLGGINGQLWFLTADNTRIVSTYIGAYGSGDRISLLDLNGKKLYGPLSVGGEADFLAASRGKVWLSLQETGTVEVWDAVAGTVKELPATGSLIDRSHDLLFTAPGATGMTGPTSLSVPGTPAWTAFFTPMAVSPDGLRVAGLAGDQITNVGTYNPNPDIEIRRVSDGTLLRRIHVTNSTRYMNYAGEIWWESNTSILVAETMPYRSFLIRCSVSGTCVTTAPSVTSDWWFSHRSQTDWHQLG
ncbi:hypothetical protein [Nocardioides ultimimeridianus]